MHEQFKQDTLPLTVKLLRLRLMLHRLQGTREAMWRYRLSLSERFLTLDTVCDRILYSLNVELQAVPSVGAMLVQDAN